MRNSEFYQRSFVSNSFRVGLPGSGSEMIDAGSEMIYSASDSGSSKKFRIRPDPTPDPDPQRWLYTVLVGHMNSNLLNFFLNLPVPRRLFIPALQ